MVAERDSARKLTGRLDDSPLRLRPHIPPSRLGRARNSEMRLRRIVTSLSASRIERFSAKYECPRKSLSTWDDPETTRVTASSEDHRRGAGQIDRSRNECGRSSAGPSRRWRAQRSPRPADLAFTRDSAAQEIGERRGSSNLCPCACRNTARETWISESVTSRAKTMSEVFISHVQEDGAVALRLATDLLNAGYATWYYERDAIAGTSYLRQVMEAIGQCEVFLVIISPASLASIHVDRELTHAYEKGKHLLPLLSGLTFGDFELQKPDWKFALGPTVASLLPSTTGSDITRALKSMGIDPRGAVRASDPEDEILVRLEIGPNEIAREIKPLLFAPELHCTYRMVANGSEHSAPCSILAMLGGLFVTVPQVPRSAMIQLEVSYRGRSWVSAFLRVDTVFTPLLREM